MSPTGKVFDKFTRHLHGEACFADSSRTRDRSQMHVLTKQEFFRGSYFLFRGRNGFIPPY